MFTYIALVLLSNEPPSCLYIFEGHIGTWIGLVAPQNDRKEKTVPHQHISEQDVGDVDAGLGRARTFRIERVEHAARTTFIWLFLLLGTKINSPPYWFMHSDVFIHNVVDDSVPIVSWIGLNVDSLERLFEKSISEGDVSHAVAFVIRRHAANGESDPQPDRNVLDEHVLGTVDHPSNIGMSGFGHNDVIVVLAGYVEDVEVPASWVNSVCVDREEWNDAGEVISSEDVPLSSRVDLDVQIIKCSVNCLACAKVETR
jgi:hypothetical protein